jgi:hypothetical protein
VGVEDPILFACYPYCGVLGPVIDVFLYGGIFGQPPDPRCLWCERVGGLVGKQLSARIVGLGIDVMGILKWKLGPANPIVLSTPNLLHATTGTGAMYNDFLSMRDAVYSVAERYFPGWTINAGMSVPLSDAGAISRFAELQAYYQVWPVSQVSPGPPQPPPPPQGPICPPGTHPDATGEFCVANAPIPTCDLKGLALSLWNAVKLIPEAVAFAVAIGVLYEAEAWVRMVALITAEESLLVRIGGSALLAASQFRDCAASLLPLKKLRLPHFPPPLDPPIGEMAHIVLTPLPTPTRTPVPQFALAPTACNCGSDFEEEIT